MKVMSVIRILAGLELAVLGCALAHAQAEINPDHFDSPILEPLQKPKINPMGEAGTIRYDGKFTLPYTVECNGKSLRPGKYSLSLHSDGKIGQVTLNQKGQVIGIAGIVHKPAHRRGSDALFVGHNGKSRNLLAIQVPELDLIFDPQLQIENSSDSRPKGIERLPLTKTSQEGMNAGRFRSAVNARR